MSRLNYDQFLNAPKIVAGEIAAQAHGRVYDVLNELIEDESTPTKAIPVLKGVLNNFGSKAEKRLDQVYRDLDQKLRANRGV